MTTSSYSSKKEVLMLKPNESDYNFSKSVQSVEIVSYSCFVNYCFFLVTLFCCFRKLNGLVGEEVFVILMCWYTFTMKMLGASCI